MTRPSRRPVSVLFSAVALAAGMLALSPAAGAASVQVRAHLSLDWVDGDAPAGAEVGVVVTDAAGAIKAEATTTAAPHGHFFVDCADGDWRPACPDLQSGDFVFATAAGVTAEVRAATITASLDFDADLVSGTVTAPWLVDPAQLRCTALSDGREVVVPVDPDGGSYECDFGLVSVDLVPEDDVWVELVDGEGDATIGQFPARAHLVVSKTLAGIPGASGNLPFHITLRNEGRAAAENVTLTDVMTAGKLSYLSDTSGYPHTGSGAGPIVWDLGTVPPDTEIAFDLFAGITATPGEWVVNSVLAETTVPDVPGDDSFEWNGILALDDADIGVSIRALTPDPAAGTEVVYPIEVCNLGSTASAAVDLTHAFDGPVTFLSWWASAPGWVEVSSGPATVTASIPSIAGGDCTTFFVRGRVAASAVPGTPIESGAEVSCPTDTDPADDQAVIVQTVAAEESVNLAVDQGWGGGRLVPGGEARYRVEITNTGNLPVSGAVRITDLMPPGSTFSGLWALDPIAAPMPYPPTSIDADEVIWEIPGGLPNGMTQAFEVVVDIGGAAAAGFEVVNVVSVDPQPGETSVADNTSVWRERLAASGPNLRVAKSHHWDAAGSLVYEVRFENIGDTAVDAVTVADVLPEGVTWEGDWFSPSPPPGLDGGILTWQAGRMEAGSAAAARFTVSIDDPGATGVLYVNRVEITEPPLDADPSDNAAIDVAAPDRDAALFCDGRRATIIGTWGADVLDGTPGDDVIVALGGDDTIAAGRGDDVVCGGGGNDLLLGGPGADHLFGEDGFDVLRGAAGDDQLDGGPRSDRLLPDFGNDLVDGGPGSDLVDYRSGTGPVDIDLAAGVGVYESDRGRFTITLTRIEKANGSAFDDLLEGDGRRNVLRGFKGEDDLWGRGGDDDLIGGLGDDLLGGGSGADLLKGQGDDDLMVGDDGDDRLVGGHGNDDLSGGAGDDVLRGGLKVHRLLFTNVIDGGSGTDDCLWWFDDPVDCE